ncbi:hypothetical protein D9V37_09740 [Nocardioides mangrovicus]|uniref:Bulb-type lectin domain-containing protein n=1 Tax=Nocardioides mangrovicus TaxID=2478913 RepID=A0A3L8P1N9_9ACTN|nr:hypothetical protein [Nocardioides mangrovicus]RLV48877.1 hypothetical protein D9V37_09740 [Nocardioides mangrovicus]
MKRHLITATTLLTALVGLLSAPALTSAAQAAATCPTYYGCVYSNSQGSSITYKWKAYGTYPIYGQNGDHLVVNSQTGGAYLTALDKNKKELWTLQDGRNGAPPRSAVKDLGPVYYFRLSPGPSCWPRCV